MIDAYEAKLWSIRKKYTQEVLKLDSLIGEVSRKGDRSVLVEYKDININKELQDFLSSQGYTLSQTMSMTDCIKISW